MFLQGFCKNPQNIFEQCQQVLPFLPRERVCIIKSCKLPRKLQQCLEATQQTECILCFPGMVIIDKGVAETEQAFSRSEGMLEGYRMLVTDPIQLVNDWFQLSGKSSSCCTGRG